MNKKLLSVLAALVCLSVLLFAVAARADADKDFGDYTDEDYTYAEPAVNDNSGYSDLGGYEYDDSGYYGYNYGFGTPIIMGGQSCSSSDLLMVLIIVGIILLVLWFIKRNQKEPIVTDVHRTDDAELKSMEDYIANHDPNFSVVDLQKKLSNLYVQMQNNWCDFDISPLRPYLTDELYEQCDRQLNAIRKSEKTPHVENIAVLGTNVRGYFQRDNMDHIIVEMSTRITDYLTDNNTGAVVKGSNSIAKYMTYEWDLVRPTGTKTEENAEMQVVNCPNCGAPVSINKTAKCPFCDSVITVNAKDWVLATIKGLSQKSGN